MDPSYNNNFNGANPGGMTPGGFPENNMPISSGTGDIVLSSGNNKKPKAWLVVLWMVAMIAIIIAVWFFVFSGNGPMGVPKEEIVGKWTDYYSYLVYGPNNNDTKTEVSASTWFPVLIGDTELELSEKDYYDELYKKLGEYYEIANNNGINVNDYYDKMSVFVNYNKLLEVRENMIKQLIDGSEEQALSYVNSVSKTGNSEDDDLMSMYLQKYLADDLELAKIYYKNGCYLGYVLVASCAEKNNNDSVIELIRKTSAERGTLDWHYNNSFSKVMFSETRSLNEQMEMMKK